VDNLYYNHTGASQAMFFDQLEPGHLGLLMSVAPMDPSPTRSGTVSLSEDPNSPTHLNCDRYNIITFVAPSFIYKNFILVLMVFSAFNIHAKFLVCISGPDWFVSVAWTDPSRNTDTSTLFCKYFSGTSHISK